MISSPTNQERFTKQKFLDFLQHGSTYKPFKGNTNQKINEFSNLIEQDILSDRKVESNISSSLYKDQIFQPYQQERNGIGKIIMQKKDKKNELEIEFEKKLSQYEQYKKKILHKDLIDSLQRVKNFKIDTACPLTPRSQPIQKNGKLMFDKGLKVKQQLFIQNKKNTLLASISQFSNQQSIQNLFKTHSNQSQANQRVPIETKIIDLKQPQDQLKYPKINQNKTFGSQNKQNKIINLQNQYHVLNYLNNTSEDQDKIQLSKTCDDHSLEDNINSSTSYQINKNHQKTHLSNYYLTNPHKNSKQGEVTSNTSNRSFLTSIRQDESKTTLNQSKLTNSEQTTNKQSIKQTLNQIQASSEELTQENPKSEIILSNDLSSKRPYFPQLVVNTENQETLQREAQFAKDKQSSSQKSAGELQTSENIKDNRTFYQTNLPNLNQSSYLDYQDVLFYCHDLDDMTPFESFKKYKFNNPKNGLYKQLDSSVRLKIFQQKKNKIINSNNESQITDRCFSDRYKPESIAPPVGTYSMKYGLIEKKVPAYTIKPEHLKQIDYLYYLKNQSDKTQIKAKTLRNFKKLNKYISLFKMYQLIKSIILKSTEVDEESFEKMYFDLMKSIQNEVQEQIQKCGDKYLHPDGDLQLQRHLSIEDIKEVDSRFKVQAKHLKDKLNKMKAYLTFYQYQV